MHSVVVSLRSNRKRFATATTSRTSKVAAWFMTIEVQSPVLRGDQEVEEPPNSSHQHWKRAVCLWIELTPSLSCGMGSGATKGCFCVFFRTSAHECAEKHKVMCSRMVSAE